jgi:hypothetical protein
MKIKFALFHLLFMVCLCLSSGCAYLKNRGNDALDIMDLGFTVNDRIEPQIGLYIDFFNILPLGYSNVEGKIIGFGNRQAGWLDHADNSWGVIFWGREMKALGEFNPKDPHRTRKDQRDLTQWPYYNVGLARMISEDDIPPTPQFIECQRVFHFGWIGFIAHLRPVDLADFILGWTTLDIVGDDYIKQ